MYRLQISEELKGLMLAGKKQRLPKGHIIQSTEDGRSFTYLDSGYVKRYLIANDGTIGVQVLYGPGDFFPITLAFSVLFDQSINQSPEVYYYETIAESEVYMLDAAAFKEEVERNKDLYRGLLAISGKRLHSTLHGLENLTLSNSYHRVTHEIYYIALRFGEKTAGGTKICLPLTHQDLANILSLTRETVSMCMVQLREKGLIKTGRNIVVPDLKELEKEAFS